jgi:hypothetical protein
MLAYLRRELRPQPIRGDQTDDVGPILGLPWVGRSGPELDVDQVRQRDGQDALSLLAASGRKLDLRCSLRRISETSRATSRIAPRPSEDEKRFRS